MMKACGGITQRHACKAEKQQQRLAVTCSTNVESFAEVSKKGISRESANFWREKRQVREWCMRLSLPLPHLGSGVVDHFLGGQVALVAYKHLDLFFIAEGGRRGEA